MKRRTALAALALFVASIALAATPSELIELRNRGQAELENEQPANAAEIYRRMIQLAPDEPLGHANLAVAALRQQAFEEALASIDRALAIAPDSGRLAAIKADVLQWSGDSTAALPLYRRAAELARDDVELQYALFRHLTTVTREPDEALLDATLARLAALRPENVLVLIQQGRRALARGDRATASSAFLRLGELLWQAPPGSDRLQQAVIDALNAGDLDAAALPAQRLENVLKITPMYREGLRELSSGIQGIPLERLRDEPPAAFFGDPVAATFRMVRRADSPGVGAALVTGDFDGDGTPDVARVVGGEAPGLEIRLSGRPAEEPVRLPAAEVTQLTAADLDNDGRLDLVGHGPVVRFWRNGEDGFADATAELGLTQAAGGAAAVIDFDIEGDLDLVLAGPGVELWRNNLQGALEAVGDKVLPEVSGGVAAVVASDLDRDGDLDLALAGEQGLRWLDNLRQGSFSDRSEAAGLPRDARVTSLVSADLDADGRPELVAAGTGVAVLHNDGEAFSPWAPAAALGTSARFDAVVAFDADNDGRLDLAVGGPGGVAVAAQRGDAFGFLPVDGGAEAVTALATADLDADGDLDLVAHGPGGLYRFVNEGGNANHWLTVRLRGLDKGNSKNNVLGFGSVVEVRAGAAYQFREAAGDSVHFGLGSRDSADLLRVVWTNGVPQNRLDPKLDQWIVEEQLLKGSCPFLYVLADGEVRFVTDLLWNAPAGLPVAPGVYAPADPSELVAIGEVAPAEGRWDLRVTEELWEAAFFDATRLWVVDHPADVEVASNLKVGAPGDPEDDRVLAARELRPLAKAVDAAGRDVSDVVRRRDEIYADGWRPSPYQGVAAQPWTFTLDLGAAPERPVRLWLDGWIFPADASLNLAVAQRTDLAPSMPRLEVETADGWRTLVERMGHPAGKTKTMVVDTPPLPRGARRLRIVSGQWISWDRIAWSTAPADEAVRVAARLDPLLAELRYRGFSALRREAPNAPHSFDYGLTTTESPWLPFPGRYTRYGDVRELLLEADDRSVIMAPGDEIRLLFDATGLEPPPPGWRRTLFLESHGWDKDADRNTLEPERLEPLPFRAMKAYGEPFPERADLVGYREEWLTREVERRP